MRDKNYTMYKNLECCETITNSSIKYVINMFKYIFEEVTILPIQCTQYTLHNYILGLESCLQKAEWSWKSQYKKHITRTEMSEC